MHKDPRWQVVATALGKYPLLFANPLYFGKVEAATRLGEVRSATATLVDLGSGPILITCAHVLTEYRNAAKRSGETFFQVGNCAFNPLAQLIDEDARLDLATMLVTPDQIAAMSDGHEAIGTQCYRPAHSWPVPAVEVDQFVCVGGFPAQFRAPKGFATVESSTWSVGATPIVSVQPDRVIAQFRRPEWVKLYGPTEAMGLRALGGLSGGPAFVDRGLYFDLVAIVTDYGPELDTMLLTPSQRIRIDGTLRK